LLAESTIKDDGIFPFVQRKERKDNRNQTAAARSVLLLQLMMTSALALVTYID